ncbi:hypothetical protein ACRRTK_024138 [Alexandromys fortis]
MSGSPAATAAAAWASRRLPRGPRGLSRPPPRAAAAALRASPPARARPPARGAAVYSPTPRVTCPAASRSLPGHRAARAQPRDGAGGGWEKECGARSRGEDA